MRKIFLIALFLSATAAVFGQRYTPFNGYGFEARRLKADSVMLIPSDTTANKTGIVRIGSSLYVGNGTFWTQVQAGAIASDSLTFATKATLYKVADSLGAIISTSSADSSIFSTKAYRQKGIDSVQANLTAGLAFKLNITDSSLYASRGRLYKVTDSLGGILGTKLSILDSATFSTKAWRQKGVDSVSALISPRITDSLRALVRLRAQGSGGIDLQNSSGTSVASFGSGGTTNISLNGSTNVNARLNVTDSIVGVNQRLTGNIQAATFNGSALGSYAFRSSGLAELSGATFTGSVIFSSQVRSKNEAGFLLRNNDDNATFGGFVRESWWFGNANNNPTIFAETGLGINLVVGGLINRGLFLASTGAATLSSSATVQGALTANGKATFTDSIVGVSQRLTGSLTVGGSTLVTQAGLFGGASSLTGINGGIATNGASNSGVQFRTGDVSRGWIYGTSSRITIEGASGIGFSVIPNAGSSPSILADTDGSVRFSNPVINVDSSVTSTSYTLVIGDAGYLKRCSNASAITITVPTNASVAFPIGTTIYFSQQGAGKVSVSPASSDVTIQSEGNLLGTAGQHAVIGLIKVNTNRWLLVGNRG